MDDIEAIKQLKARYFRCLDTKDWEGFSAVFTDDFVSDTRESGGKKVTGRDSFVVFVKKSLGARTTVHHGHTCEIEITSETTARGIWAMEDLVRFGVFDLNGFGHYHETYVKIAGKWYINYSKLTRLRMDMKTAIVSIKIPDRTLKKFRASAQA